MKEVNIYRPELDYSANESYKSLRTNLLFCGEEKKVIAVTSCTPNEGKSTVSLNLALKSGITIDSMPNLGTGCPPILKS